MIARALIALCVLLSICSVSIAEASSLHAILVMDTTSPTGDAAEKDMARLQTEMSLISAYTGLTLKSMHLSGPDVTPTKVLKAVQSLVIESTDTVIFYYVGHGYRTTKKNTVWPLLFLSPERRSVDLQDVIDAIIMKHPRLGLIIADCCNNVIDGAVTLSPEIAWPEAKKKVDIKKSYRTLFVDSGGIIIACAAKSGDYAYCHKEGHYFTEAFLKSLHFETLRPSPRWADLFLRASSRLHSFQEPYHEILSYP